MLARLVIAALILGIFSPIMTATPGPAAGDCDIYRHQSVTQVLGTVNTGDNEAWANNPGCGIAKSPTEVLEWAGGYSAPVFLGVGTAAWAGSGFGGCTLSAITATNNILASVTGGSAHATLTMTSAECHGLITLTLSIAPAYVFTAEFPVNVRVEQPNYSYFCGATGVAETAFSPSATSCNIPVLQNANLDYICAATGAAPSALNLATTACNTQHLIIDSMPTVNIAGSLTTSIASWPGLSVGITSWPSLNIASMPTLTVNDQVHILDSVTLHHILDSGTLTVNGIAVNQTVGNVTVSFPRELALQICGPNFINTSVCSPVEVNANATVDGTHNISMLFPFLIFLLLIVWAEISRQFELYIIAVVVGMLAVITLWTEIVGMRLVLLAILVFLCFRGYTNYKERDEE